MGVIDRLVRLLKDDYKVGVEAESGHPVVYINPNRIDQWALQQAINRNDADAAAAMIGDQLDEQYPGLSGKLTNDEKLYLLKNSLESGPFADKILMEKAGICVINQPLGSQINTAQMMKTLGVEGPFKPEHLRPLPGDNALWKEIVGRHEGEHCNQPAILVIDPEARLKILRGETLSDRKSIKALREAGHEDVAQAFIDMRVLSAGNGDDTHATSILIDAPEDMEITKEHLEAAGKFKREMIRGVAAELSITIVEAAELREKDPQRFAKTVDAVQRAGKIPVPRDMTKEEVDVAVAAEMGLTPAQFRELPLDRAAEMAETQARLLADGKLKAPGDQNPHIQEYIRQYVGAIDRLLVPDTTPPPPIPKPVHEPVAAEAPETPETKKEEEPELTPEELAAEALETEKYYAANYAPEALSQAIMKMTGKTDEELVAMTTEDPEAVLALAERAIAEGLIPSIVVRPATDDERDAMVAKALRVSPEERAEKYPVGSYAYQQVYKLLERADMLKVSEENRQMPQALRDHLDELKAELAALRAQQAKDAEAEAAADAPAEDEPEAEAPTAPAKETESAAPAALAKRLAAAPASTPGTYDYLIINHSDLRTGEPQIDLAAGDRAQLKIGRLSPGEYFAVQADPVLAAERLALAQAIEQTPDVARAGLKLQAQAAQSA